MSTGLAIALVGIVLVIYIVLIVALVAAYRQRYGRLLTSALAVSVGALTVILIAMIGVLVLS